VASNYAGFRQAGRTNVTDAITEQAVAWHLAQQRADMDWEAFALWLDADPRHREAYDAVARIDDLVERNRETLARLVPDAPAAPTQRRLWWTALGGAVAAGLVLFLTLTPREVAAPAQHFAAQHSIRTLRLGDGTRIDLAPASSVDIKGQEITLAGAAAFDVPHRPDRTLLVHAGGIDVRDIGTRFEISGAQTTVLVAVAEGQVALASPNFAQPVPLSAGKRALVDRAAQSVAILPADVREFASWRRGRLSYDDAPLSLVAADIGRYADATVTIDPALAGRRFTGVLTIGDGSRLADNLAQIMGLDIRREADRIRLVARRDR
jgi:transmembrane sensor